VLWYSNKIELNWYGTASNSTPSLLCASQPKSLHFTCCFVGNQNLTPLSASCRTSPASLPSTVALTFSTSSLRRLLLLLLPNPSLSHSHPFKMAYGGAGPAVAGSNSTPTIKQVKLEKECELRIEVSDSPLRLRLLNGNAEIFGTELPPEIWLNFPPGLKFAVTLLFPSILFYTNFLLDSFTYHFILFMLGFYLVWCYHWNGWYSWNWLYRRWGKSLSDYCFQSFFETHSWREEVTTSFCFFNCRHQWLVM